MEADDRFMTNIRNDDPSHIEVEEPPELYESSDCSDDSSEGAHEVDAVVQEDMGKLEDIFDNMGFKFRMIDRIGEGQ